MGGLQNGLLLVEKNTLGTTVVTGVTTSATCILFFFPVHFEGMYDGSAKLHTVPPPAVCGPCFDSLFINDVKNLRSHKNESGSGFVGPRMLKMFLCLVSEDIVEKGPHFTS